MALLEIGFIPFAFAIYLTKRTPMMGLFFEVVVSLCRWNIYFVFFG